MSRQQSLERVIRDSDCLSFPTLTSNVSSTSRPAGQTKCEKWFKDNGLIPNGSQLGTQAIALTMGFPSSWFEDLSQPNSNQTNTLSQATPQAESEQDTWQEEPLHQDKQRSLSVESSSSQKLLEGNEKLLEHEENNHSPLGSEVLLGGEKLLEHKESKRSSPNQKISIPCLVKQPKQPEARGIIQKDLGDRFLVNVGDEIISVSKLFVYPDFSESVGQTENNPRKNLTPSTNSPRKVRRKRGQGNGSIYYRTVTKSGKEYPEAYYHWQENGKKRTKYIPKRLLTRVEEAESLKLPVSDILVLLGGDKKNPRKSSSTSSARVEEKLNDSFVEQVLETNDLNPRKNTPPSKRRRTKGKGSGWIECKPIKRNGKEYQQYWYHYEEWQEGDRLIKKSRYIPKRLLSRIEKMEVEKVSVREILEVLGVER